MLHLVRLKSYITGWLAIPASLLLLVNSGYPETQSVDLPGGPASHSHSEMPVKGSPFEKVFKGESDFVVLTFFDMYCVACQQSAENFRILNEKLPESIPGKVIQVTGIGIGDTELELKVFERKYKLGYKCLPDPEKTFESPFALRGTPTILVFQRKGSDCLEIFRHEGRFRTDDMEELINTIRQLK